MKKFCIVRKTLLILFAVIVGFSVISLIAVNRVEAASEIVPQMVKGASIRYGENNAKNGIRFSMTLEKEKYETLTNENKNIEFGLFIAPAEYTAEHPINEENTFGENSVYDWAVRNEETGEWEYDGTNGAEGGKIRIMRFVSDKLFWCDDLKAYTFSGAIVDILQDNLTREFYATSYLKITENGVDKYVFSPENDNVRSAAYVAQLSISDTSESAPTVIQKEWLQKNYIDAVKDKTETYKTEIYLEHADGMYVLNNEMSVLKKGTLDVQVQAEAKTIAGYAFDENNPLNVTEGKVLANGKLVLKLYYSLASRDLGEISGESHDFGEYILNGANLTLVKKVLNKEYVVENVPFQGTILDLSALEDGAYSVTASLAERKICISFDLVNGAKAWNTASADVEFYTYMYGENSANRQGTVEKIQLQEADHAGEFYKLSYNSAADDLNSKNFAFNLLPLHAKGYYEKFQNHILTFDYYVSNSGMWIGCSQPDTNHSEGWYTGKVPLEKLLEIWDKLDGEDVAGDGGYVGAEDMRTQSMFFVAGIENSGQYVYIGNFRLGFDVELIKHDYLLKDVTGSESFDLTSLLSEDEKLKISSYKETSWRLTDRAGKTYYPDGGAVDFAKIPHACYTAEVIFVADGAEYVLFRGDIDLYDSASEPVWNTVDNAEFVWSWSGGDSVGGVLDNGCTVVQLQEDGHTGNYFKLTAPKKEGVVRWNIRAVHDKAYYEKFKDYTLTFEFLAPADSWVGWGWSDTSGRYEEWHTASISVATLLANWGNIEGKEWANNYNCMFFSSQFELDGDRFIYLGDFRLVAP